MAPVLYERIDENNVRIGTKWFKFRREVLQNTNWFQEHAPKVLIPFGVTIYHDSNAKQFNPNDWYPINTSGTYEEFERSFELWIKSLDEEIGRL